MAAQFPACPRHELLQRMFGDRCLIPDAHPGLVFDRYFRLWERPGVRVAKIEGPLHDFAAAYARAGQSPDVRERLADIHRRLDGIVSANNGRTNRYKTQSRLATGLGADHPLDNGFVFDPAVGVPYLPGSSVKGLCHAWAELTLGREHPDMLRLFGVGPQEAEETGERERVGGIVFLPAYPQDWPELDVDIVNNHHRAYYGAEPSRRGGKGRFPPMDIESPIPVYFLAVRAKTTFVFRVLPHAATLADSDLEQATGLLANGLRWLGIGAKSAVGYGVVTDADKAVSK